MPQDAIDDPRLCNEGDNLHAGATGADQKVRFENLLQQAKQLAVALDESAQDARDRKRPVTVRNWSENVRGEFFGKEHGALGLTTGAEIPGAA